MTEHEIVRESKQAWELLNDLCDNSQIASDNDRSNMRRCMNSLENVYGIAWQMMYENKKEHEQLQTSIKCPKCGNKLLLSDLIGYAYLCENCDENMYYTECEIVKVWWNND